MKKECQKLFESITNVDDAFIEEAQRAQRSDNLAGQKTKGFLWANWGILAACICLILCIVTVFTTTVIANTGPGAWVIDLFTSRTEPGSDYSESGYDVSIDIEKIPMDSFTGEIHEVQDIIVQQWKNANPISSWYPGSWYKEFSSSAKARKYIGLDSLQGLKWNLKEQSTTLWVTGDREGNIETISLEMAYKVGDIRLQAYSIMYTENDDEEVTIGGRTTEDLQFTEKYFTTEGQLQCLVITSTAMESGYLGIEGYLVENGVLYWLHIAYLEEDAEEAEKLLHQWANLF